MRRYIFQFCPACQLYEFSIISAGQRRSPRLPAKSASPEERTLIQSFKASLAISLSGISPFSRPPFPDARLTFLCDRWAQYPLRIKQQFEMRKPLFNNRMITARSRFAWISAASVCAALSAFSVSRTRARLLFAIQPMRSKVLFLDAFYINGEAAPLWEDLQGGQVAIDRGWRGITTNQPLAVFTNVCWGEVFLG